MYFNVTTHNLSDSELGHINPTVSAVFLTFNLLICADLIGIFGLIGNVINILNFAKQGLHDSVTVTLTSLSVSDMGSLLFQMVVNICWGYGNMPITPSVSVQFYYPHYYFTRVSGFITAFAAFERCLCVVLPLKVKTIITRKVSIAVNCVIFIVLSLYVFPFYYMSYIDFKYNPKTNKTVLTFLFRENSANVFRISFFTNDLVVPYVSFLILILCTAIIVTSLKSKAQWRRSVTVATISQLTSKEEVISMKEKKTVVMLTTVSVLFVALMTPGCAMLTAVGFVQDFQAEGEYFDLTMLVLSFTLLLETINCSVNTLIYYTMSSKYREIIQAWFPCLRKQTKFQNTGRA